MSEQEKNAPVAPAGSAVPALAPAALAEREGLSNRLRELEAFVARSEADGEALPPEARQMVDRLREIMRALDDLNASLAHETGEEP